MTTAKGDEMTTTTIHKAHLFGDEYALPAGITIRPVGGPRCLYEALDAQGERIWAAPDSERRLLDRLGAVRIATTRVVDGRLVRVEL